MWKKIPYLALSHYHTEWPYEHDSSHFSARRAGIVTNTLIIHTSIVSAWYKIRKGMGPTQTLTRGLCLFSLVPSIIWLKKSWMAYKYKMHQCTNSLHCSHEQNYSMRNYGYNTLPPALVLNCKALPINGKAPSIPGIGFISLHVWM